jgi:hypothetical protein
MGWGLRGRKKGLVGAMVLKTRNRRKLRVGGVRPVRGSLHSLELHMTDRKEG